jgi:hypothetical protein
MAIPIQRRPENRKKKKEERKREKRKTKTYVIPLNFPHSPTTPSTSPRHLYRTAGIRSIAPFPEMSLDFPPDVRGEGRNLFLR